MKKLSLLVGACCLLLSMQGFSVEPEEKQGVTSIEQVKEIIDIQEENLDFEVLSQQPSVGSLKECVGGENSFWNEFLEVIGSAYMLYPNQEFLGYVNGVFCHVGYYPKSIIYTVLEGPYYGLQTTTTRSGRVLHSHTEYFLEQTAFGVVLHHRYTDSEVVTGSNQVILLDSY